MGGFGFGFRRGSRTPKTPVLSEAWGIISPSAAWTGAASSGFTSPPQDPVRTTAKPVMRLIVPPNQAYTDELVVGVYAGANNLGSLIDNMGLQSVIAHYEGQSVVIAQPGYHNFRDANDRAVRYFGWWIRLKRDGRNGLANLYFEAVPKDTTMQRRVIGPFQFAPSAQLYDYQIEVAATPSEVTGVRYKTIKNAMDYLRGVNAKNPMINIVEAGTYDLTSMSVTYDAPQYCNIVASVPVTIGKTTPSSSDAASVLRTRWGGMHFIGENITFDLRYAQYVYHDSAAGGEGRQDWYDGIRIINSDPAGRAALWRKGSRAISQVFRDYPWLTECMFSDLGNAGYSATLARGCFLKKGNADIFTNASCILANRVDDWDSTEDLTRYAEAFSVTYTGTGTTATLQMSGGNDATSRTLTATVNGTSVGTFTIGNTDVLFAAGTNYNVADVVAWLNSLSDWTATVIDNSRRASALQAAGTIGVWGPIAVNSVAQTLYTYFDLHTDFYQKLHDNILKENVVIADNIASNLVAQCIFLTGVGGCADILIVNNAFDCKNIQTGLANNYNIQSQMAAAHSHVVMAHNSFSRQGLALRTDGQSYNPDTYCLIANNVLRSIVWAASADADLSILGNHLFAGATVPANAVGTIVNGDGDSLFNAPTRQDFMPRGGLVPGTQAPVVAYDRTFNRRAALAPAGAVY